MIQIDLSPELKLSRIVHGQMRMAEWKLSQTQLLRLIEQLLDLGITTFDHADIYGNYSCESLLGGILSKNGHLRDKIQIITKCGIKLKSEKFPERQVKIYDYSYDHIITSVNTSLKNFHTGHIDLLLLHRPAPFFNPEDVAQAFSVLKREGKVLNFGVSNFTPLQFEMLDSYTDEKLVTNQVEISPYCLEHFENGNIDFFLKERIQPMAWSPLAWGKLLSPTDEKGSRILKTLTEISEELRVFPVEKIIYAWLLQHPVNMMLIPGSGNIKRIQYAVDALELTLSKEQWYSIYIASKGMDLP